jgi:SAM-dependent methyltransferase
VLGKSALVLVARSGADWVDIYLSGLRKLVRAAARYSHGRLLDVGCGKKPYEPIFAPFVNEYVGIEYGDTFGLTHDASQNAPDFIYDGRTLPFADGSFDTVVSFSVLEHTPEPGRLFAEMARVLRPRGTMIQHVPFSFRLHEEPHDYYRFTAHALRALSAENGLAVRAIRAQGSLWSVLAHKIVTFLAFRVLRITAAAQALGKLGMETTNRSKPRYLLAPIVAPIMVATVALARILERVVPIHDDTLGFILVAEKPPISPHVEGDVRRAAVESGSERVHDGERERIAADG